MAKAEIYLGGFKDELWNAFSDGGELEWIEDLQLLDVFSFAYHYIRRLIYLEKVYVQLRYHSGPKSRDGIADLDKFTGCLVEIYNTAIEPIDHALREVGKALVVLKSGTEGVHSQGNNTVS
jgi:hypothetical protein